MADTGITKDEMFELFEKFFGSPGGGGGGKPGGGGPIKDVDAFIKQLKESTEALKKQVPVQKQLEALMQGQKQNYINIDNEIEQLDKQIEELTEQAKKHGDFNKRDAVQKERDSKVQTVAANNARVAVANFAVNVGNVAETLIKGAFQYAKDLQSGASGIEAGTSAASTAARAAGDTVSAVGEGMSGLGSVVGLLGGKFKFVGVALDLLGNLLGVFGKKAATVSEEGIKFLGEEVKKTQKAFKDITDTGAAFGGGMTEMRNVAARAGLDITQLSTVVKNAKEDLVAMGVGIGEATKRLAGVSRELRGSDLGMQLRKLGYSAEEQAALGAQVAANLNATGKLRSTSDAEVAQMTVQYGKDLKILADITGKDAKKAAEKARMESLKSAVYGKLNDEQRMALQGVLRAMPEELQKGFLEKIASGGGAITDVATNVAMQANKQIGTSFDVMYDMVLKGSKDGSDAQAIALREREKMGQAQLEANKNSNDLYTASVLKGGNAVIDGASSLGNALTKIGVEQLPGAADKVTGAVNAAAANMAPLDVAVHKVEENAQKLRAAMGEQLTGAITTFAGTMASATTTIGEALAKVGLKQESTSEKVGEAAGGVVGGLAGGKGGAALGAAIGTAIMPGIGTAIGGGIGYLGGMLAGGWLGSKLGKKAGGAFNNSKTTADAADVDQPMVPMAVGGIVSGPTRALLGEGGMKEAVVPLPNGRSIPIDISGLKEKLGSSLPAEMLDTIGKHLSAGVKSTPLGAAVGGLGSLFGSDSKSADSSSMMQEQIALLNEIKDLLTSSNSLQQQYVYNTYQ